MFLHSLAKEKKWFWVTKPTSIPNWHKSGWFGNPIEQNGRLFLILTPLLQMKINQAIKKSETPSSKIIKKWHNSVCMIWIVKVGHKTVWTQTLIRVSIHHRDLWNKFFLGQPSSQWEWTNFFDQSMNALWKHFYFDMILSLGPGRSIKKKVSFDSTSKIPPK